MSLQMQTAGPCDGSDKQPFQVPCNKQKQMSLADDDLVSRIDHRRFHSMFRKSLLPAPTHLEVHIGMESSSVLEKQSRAPSPSRSARSFRTVRRQKAAESLRSLRFSIFGLRTQRQHTCSTRTTTSDGAKVPSVESGAEHDEGRLYKHDDFQSEHEYYLQLKKQSISPPFNFHHVTHTVRKQLPSLDNVDEKDLSARFWAVSAYQTPRRHLNGIKAENIQQSYSPMTSRPSSIARPKSLGVQSNRQYSNLCRSPTLPERRSSSSSYGKLEGLPSRPPQYQTHADVLGCALDSLLLSRSQDPGVSSDGKHFTDVACNDQTPIAQTKSDRECFGERTQDGSNHLTRISEGTCETVRDGSDRTSWLWLSTQFPQPPTHRRGDSLVAFPDPRRDYLSNDQVMHDRKLASTSEPALNGLTVLEEEKQTKSPRGSCPQNVVSGTRTQRNGTREKASWEDDVEYAYNQKLESTCDFDWAENIIAVRNRYMARTFAVSHDSFNLHTSAGHDSKESLASTQYPNGQTSTRSHFRVKHRTRPSVGHHGFVEARKGIAKAVPRDAASMQPKLRVVVDGPRDRLLSPMSSIASIGDRLFSQAPSSNTLKSSYSDGFSDPESALSEGSKHRKSSSCSSCGSFRQLSSSTSSTPELLSPCKRKSHSPTEAVPLTYRSQEQTPEKTPGEKLDNGSTAPPNGPKHSIPMMRRPETPGERAVLRAAGIAAKKQQRRPTTPSSATGSQSAIRLNNECSPTQFGERQSGWI